LPEDENQFRQTRSRNLKGINFKRRSTLDLVFPGNFVIPIESVQDSFKTSGNQVTDSESHQFPPPKGSLADVGGDFFTQKVFIASGKGISNLSVSRELWAGGPSYVSKYTGPCLAAIPPGISGGVNWPDASISSKGEMERHGTTAIARCKPDNSIAQATTFLGETYNEGLPKVVGSSTWEKRTKIAQKAGHEYLNLQFGWLPLINDVVSLGYGVTHADAVLTQYEQDAGKVVRRQYYFPTRRESDETFYLGTPWVPSNSEIGPPNAGVKITRKRETLQKRWFSGAFTYYLPTGYDSRNAMSRAALLADKLGLDLSPDSLWNLAPWSWAVDWITNTGDVLSNYESFVIDGSVMRYGYIMEHTLVTDTYTSEPYTNPNSGLKVQPKPLVLVTETKTRYGATPYGFGLTWEGLSSFQQSILTALGLTKGRR
jgi:hypothetical protein